MRSRLALLTLSTACLLGCRQVGAELRLDEPRGAEPSGIDAPRVVVEAPRPAHDDGPLLDWTAVDDSMAGLIEGERVRVDYDADHPWAGSSAPLVTIVLFYDYQCPYSQRLDDTLRLLLADYGDSLRVVWRQFPLPMHREAELASRYALAAHAQGMFAPMHDWLFANARSLSRPTIEQQASALGLDPRRLGADVDGGWIAERVTFDKDFASAKGVNSTPTMYINGRQARGAQQREKIEAIVREEIVIAQRLLAAGSSRREIWARFMAASSPEPAPKPVVAPAPGRDPNKRYTVALTGLTARGAKQPKVQILMCGDFDCPYSKRATATLEDLLKRYPKDLAVYFRHQPLTAIHKDAMAAHRAAVAADNQGKFWAMFEALYADPAQRSAAELEELAKQAGLKLAQFRKDIADAKTDELIRKHIEVCEQQLDNRGTPGFFINGRPLIGAQPITAFEAIIDEELAAAP